MDKEPLEIERKFLIAYPDKSVLDMGETTEIVQTYLYSPQRGRTERVRRRGKAGEYVYTHTIKHKINSVKRVEIESVITEEAYTKLLKRADRRRRTVHKKRCCIPYMGQTLEIDVYPFWSDKAIMEIELQSEDQQVFLPDFVRVIREVSNDVRYSNASMAEKVPID